MTVLKPRKQSRHFGYLVAQRLGNFPQRLGSPGTRPVLVVEEFGACGRLQRRGEVVHQVLSQSLPRRAVTVDYRPGLACIQILGLKRQVGYKRRLPGRDLIDRAQIGIGLARQVRSPHGVGYEAQRLVLVVECQRAFIVGAAVVGCRGIIPSVVEAGRGRNVIVEGVAREGVVIGREVCRPGGSLVRHRARTAVGIERDGVAGGGSGDDHRTYGALRRT